MLMHNIITSMLRFSLQLSQSLRGQHLNSKTPRRPYDMPFLSFRLYVLAVTSIWLSSMASASTVGGASSLSPIRHLEASLAASAGQGTIIAMPSTFSGGQDCVILVSRSPKSRNGEFGFSSYYKTQTNETTRNTNQILVQDDIRLLAASPDLMHLSPRRFTNVGSLSVCVMTGFAADIQHLTHLTVRQVESHQTLYSHPMPVDRIVKALARTMQRVAQSEGGRPFGAQVMVAGLDTFGLTSTTAMKPPAFGLYTLDPTGGWRQSHGGSGAVIGRFASDVRKAIVERKRQEGLKQDTGGMSPRETLDACVDALVQAMVKNGFKPGADRMDGLLLWAEEGGVCRKAPIDPRFMNECYQKSLEKLPSDAS